MSSQKNAKKNYATVADNKKYDFDMVDKLLSGTALARPSESYIGQRNECEIIGV